MKRHPNELRTRVVNFVKEGNSKSSAIKIFKIAKQTIYDWIKLDSNGKLTEINNYLTRKSKIDTVKLLDYVNNNPDLYYREIAEVFKSSKSEIQYLLKKEGITVKKNKRYIRKETKN